MRFVLVLMLAGAWSAAQERPAGMGLSTWVREVIFAGFLAGEMRQFEKGMKSLSDNQHKWGATTSRCMYCRSAASLPMNR